jgi:heat shock protein HtpX
MWEQIQLNKRRSAILLVLIALLLVALGFFIAEAMQPGAGAMGMLVAVIIWVVMSLVAYYQGENILLAVSGAKEIQKEDHPQLFNVVEEMTIAAGLPKMPRVYLIQDMALNAFATGRDPSNSAVAVTAGLLSTLNRDQLQGVVAHEMSHVVNRDVLLMTMAGVILGSIVMISEVFLRGLWYSGGAARSRRYRSDKEGGQAQMIMMVVAIVLAILAPFLAQLLYLAISRRREYLADANGALLTRYPEGLAGALEKIEADPNVLENATKATAPMYISNPFAKAGGMALNLVSTHPPIDERIRILRSMAGGVSYANYDTAWRQVKGKDSGVIPASALALAAAAAPVAVREANPETVEPRDPRQQMRETGDLMRKVNNYQFLDCECGLRIKLPPDFDGASVECPRCHRELDVQTARE